MTLFIQALGFGVTTGSIIALGAMGFTLQFGLTNIFNLSYGAVMTMAAFAALGLQATGISPWFDLAVAPAAGAVATMIVGRYVFGFFARRGLRLVEMVMITLAMQLVLTYGTDAADHEQIFPFAFPQGASYHLGPVTFSATQLVVLVLATTCFTGLQALLHRTRLGKSLRATAEEPNLARTCGIRTRRVVTIAWLLSGLLAGLAGLAYAINSFTVDAFSGTNFLPLVLAAAMLGRAGSISGAFVAAFAMGAVSEVVSAFGGSSYSTIAAFSVLIVVLIARASQTSVEPSAAAITV